MSDKMFKILEALAKSCYEAGRCEGVKGGGANFEHSLARVALDFTVESLKDIEKKNEELETNE